MSVVIGKMIAHAREPRVHIAAAKSSALTFRR